jgi:predicted dehydrogenase
MSSATRREFLTGIAAACGTYFVGNCALGKESYWSALEQPVMGFIGTGIRYHTALAPQALSFGPAAAVCDVDSLQLGRALQVAVDRHRERNWPLATDTYEDYRHVLDRSDVDIVLIGTPDHWHTKIVIDAMRAGKDVYCEKPLTLTIDEGRQILKVMNETNRIVQVGTQQRTEFDQMFAYAVALAHAGRIGRIERVTVALGQARQCDPLPIVPVPKSLNWDMWQGQAAVAEYREGPLVDVEGWGAGFPFSRTHNYFRWWYEYSGGKMTDWGAHHMDIALWALEKLSPDAGRIVLEPISAEHPVRLVDGMPTEHDRFNTAVTFDVKVLFDDGVELRIRDDASDLGFDNGILFEGERGRFFVNRNRLTGKPVEDLATNPLPDDALETLYGRQVPESHMANFMECVKTRRQPISDVASHHRGLAVCHAANIALRLNRTLTFDSGKDRFIDDAQANGFLTREQRRPHEIVA